MIIRINFRIPSTYHRRLINISIKTLKETNPIQPNLNFLHISNQSHKPNQHTLHSHQTNSITIDTLKIDINLPNQVYLFIIIR